MPEETGRASSFHSAEVVLPCADLDEALPFFVDRLGFRVEAIFPADSPRVAVLSGLGLRLRLEPSGGEPGTLRILSRSSAQVFDGKTVMTAPNGTLVQFVPVDSPVVVPPLHSSFQCSPSSDSSNWSVGRAGMQYRDLIPDRQGGRFIASHIRIPDGGPVPDYVHFHKVRFQMIYCYRGWVRVVYEDQGDPFVMEAGDCVLQPPKIRHRVLESSPGLEVVELGCPAEHETLADHGMTLPNPIADAARDFSGQKFQYHRAASATWHLGPYDGFEYRDLGMSDATCGLAEVDVWRRSSAGLSCDAITLHSSGELCFLFVLVGDVTMRETGGAPFSLSAGGSCVLPHGGEYSVSGCSEDLQILRVQVPRESSVPPGSIDPSE